MIKTIIVDDERKSRVTLENLLQTNCPGVKIMEGCDSVETALTAIEKHSPNLVFLDIEMPFNNGFTLFEKISNPGFDVVFTTAYDQYAIRAIRFSAMDYLLKPIDVDELKNAVGRVETKHAGKQHQPLNYELLVANLKSKSARIAVPTFDGLQMVNAEDILKCTAHESYTEIGFVNGTKLMVSRILKEYEDLLSGLNFFRIHNSCLVNLAHIKKYIKGDGGYVVMTNGESCEVARRKKAELLNRLSLLHL